MRCADQVLGSELALCQSILTLILCALVVKVKALVKISSERRAVQFHLACRRLDLKLGLPARGVASFWACLSWQNSITFWMTSCMPRETMGKGDRQSAGECWRLLPLTFRRALSCAAGQWGRHVILSSSKASQCLIRSARSQNLFLGARRLQPCAQADTDPQSKQQSQSRSEGQLVSQPGRPNMSQKLLSHALHLLGNYAMQSALMYAPGE